MIWLVASLVVLALAALGWGVFEAGWLRQTVLETPIPGLPEELDGLRVAHLGDFHLGFPSRGQSAVSKAVDWVSERKPDLRAGERRPALAPARRGRAAAADGTAR